TGARSRMERGSFAMPRYIGIYRWIARRPAMKLPGRLAVVSFATPDANYLQASKSKNSVPCTTSSPGRMSGLRFWALFRQHQTLGQLQRLPFEEAAVDAVVAAHQSFVRPFLDDAAAIEDQQAIEGADRREPVGDDDGGAAHHQP